MMHDRVPGHLKPTALFHDSEEAYWGDLIKPLKNMMPPDLRMKMREMRAVIFSKFRIDEITPEIDTHDFQLLQWDLDNLILSNNHVGWDCYTAEHEWLNRAKNLKRVAKSVNRGTADAVCDATAAEQSTKAY